MKKLVVVSLLLAFVSLVVPQQANEKSALQSMVDSELAFARMAGEQGTRAAFMAFIAEDGILFRPRAVKGKQWMIDHPLPPSDKKPLLSWYPAIAGIAAAADMGYTTGPWEFKSDIKDPIPNAFGNFLTIWKKQADGSWKFAIDLGISNPQPGEATAPWQMPKNNLRYPDGGGVGPATTNKKDIAALMEHEREFSRDSVERGARMAFEDRADSDVRLLRNGQQPMRKADAGSFLGASVINWTWQPAFADVSHSGDLGYSYGTYRQASKDTPAKVESGNYFRIWKKQAGKWLVVADLTDPLEDKKN